MNFKKTNYLFITSFLLIAIFAYVVGFSFWWLLLPVFLYKTIIIYSSANITSNFFLKAFNEGDGKQKEIVITFDDGPNKEITPKILAVLADFDAKATFFVIGNNILGNENIIKQIHADGHLIGNHTFSHSFFIDFKSRKGFLEEIEKTNLLIEKIIGKKAKIFRPPYGVTTPNIAYAVEKANMDVVGWSIRSLDTTKDSSDKISKRVISQINSGSIILFHDTSEKTIDVLKQTLNFVKNSGFKIVSLEKLLNIKAYE